MTMLSNASVLGADSGYQIANSLRVRASASAYLSRTPTVSGTSTKGTLSCWVKMGNVAANNRIGLMGRRVAADYFFMLGVSDGRFGLWMQTPSSWRAIVYTSGQFRDPSAWYHVVIHYDTNGTTGAGTYLKVYVNGELQSLSVNVAPNGAPFTGMNTAGDQMQIGYSYDNVYADVYLAHYHWTDGLEKQASDFGQYDANGVWIPKDYTGSFGTNGFRLKFENGSSLTTLGYDSSGNGNNWTLNNVSLTAGATYDWMVDTPTNNYCTLNPISVTGARAYLSHANTLVNSGGNNGGNYSVGTTMAASSGLFYYEAEVTNYNSGTIGFVGFALDSVALTAGVAGSTNTAGFRPSGGSWYSYKDATATALSTSGLSNGHILNVAFNASTGNMWIGKNGVWENSGNPATGANPTLSGLAAGNWTPAINIYQDVTNSIAFYVNFGQRPFQYSPPTGFKALCTSNLS